MLVVLAIFKNESHILDEWITHYRTLGVSHFHLINNGSTDNFNDAIKMHNSYITLYNLNEAHSQRKYYTQIMNEIRKIKSNEWCLIVDLDEFVYPTDETITLLDFCKKTMPRNGQLSQVTIPWKIFGSNGHITQPASVRTEFIKSHETISQNGVKSLFRIDRLKKDALLGIHFQDVIGQSKRVNDLICNHYIIQSWDFFSNIKMKRGSAATVNHDHLRTKEYFKQHDDLATATDTILKDRVIRGMYIKELI